MVVTETLWNAGSAAIGRRSPPQSRLMSMFAAARTGCDPRPWRQYRKLDLKRFDSDHAAFFRPSSAVRRETAGSFERPIQFANNSCGLVRSC